MTIHYHGSPIWGNKGEIAKFVYRNGGAFISYLRRDQLKLALSVANSVAIDNGAFSAWRRGVDINWEDYYSTIEKYYDDIEFFVIPDVVEGGEEDNDNLIKSVPSGIVNKSVPVWHMHESFDRLYRLCSESDRVCIGSSGIYSHVRSKQWEQRMTNALKFIFVEKGLRTKLHGLRMLDGRVLGRYPLASADSTNIACNIPKTIKVMPEITKHYQSIGFSNDEIKLARAAILKNTIEKVIPPTIEEWVSKW